MPNIPDYLFDQRVDFGCVNPDDESGRVTYIAFLSLLIEVYEDLECAPRGGQNQAAVLTVCRAC